jgi:FYVE zinc finger
MSENTQPIAVSSTESQQQSTVKQVALTDNNNSQVLSQLAKVMVSSNGKSSLRRAVLSDVNNTQPPRVPQLSISKKSTSSATTTTTAAAATAASAAPVDGPPVPPRPAQLTPRGRARPPIPPSPTNRAAAAATASASSDAALMPPPAVPARKPLFRFPTSSELKERNQWPIAAGADADDTQPEATNTDTDADANTDANADAVVTPDADDDTKSENDTTSSSPSKSGSRSGSFTEAMETENRMLGEVARAQSNVPVAGSDVQTFDYEVMRQKILNKQPLNQREIDEIDAYSQALQNGSQFTKFGRHGKPRTKYVICTPDGKIFWTDTSGGRTMTCIKLLEVTNIFSGKRTPVFARKVAAKIPEELCLSVVTPDRSLDLQAEDELTRDLWVKALRYAAANVMCKGTVTRFPVTTTEQERKERALEHEIQIMQKEIDNLRNLIQRKNNEIVGREQQLVLERRNSKAQLHDKELTLKNRLQELEELQSKRVQLENQLTKVQHERKASRQLRMATIEALQQKVETLEHTKDNVEKQATDEKKQMTKIINDSHRLLAKAKQTIHKRQASRADKISMLEQLRQETEQLRLRNLEMQREIAGYRNLTPEEVEELQRTEKRTKELASQIDQEHKLASVPENVNSDPHMMRLMQSEVIRPAAWQPDSASDHCMKCDNRFTFFNRRHHCRRCGLLVCDDCSKARIPTSNTSCNVRVCSPCVKEMSQFKVHAPSSSNPSVESISMPAAEPNADSSA